VSRPDDDNPAPSVAGAASDGLPSRAARDLGPAYELDPVLEVASDLFVAEGLIITFRWLQKDTGVPAAELAERFGTIDGLLAEVLRYGLRRIWAEYENSLPRFDASVLSSPVARRYWHVLGRAVLAGRDVAALQGDFPAIENHTRQLMKLPETTSLAAAQMGAAQSTALMIGWILLEDFIVPAAKLDGLTPEEIRADVFETIASIGQWRAQRPSPGDPHPL